jgi:chromosome segregation protein
MKEYYEEEERCLSLEKEIELESSNKREVMDKLTELESLLKKTISSSSTYQNKINELNVDIVKLNMNLDNLLNRLGEEYSLTYEGAKDKYSLDIEEKEARKIVSELKKTIKSIGNVNLESIEEYERVNKRYTFLNTQKEDLLKSEKDLLEIINNMDDIMKGKFESTFHKINEEFSKVFKNLFGGGEASLSLTEPNNILETGIEIVAIPPGKNLKPLSLLSGGEKTLTAISLLFSIMNLKKVPFVILDEVESALDEVNAEKFGEYLSNYRGKTQLLVITHKKKTMEYLDLLYGVTMQESGVSKLVSVKLENI